MTTVSELIDYNVGVATDFNNRCAEAVADIAVPRETIGYTVLGINFNTFDAQYKPPTKDNTANPVYVNPAQSLPTKPALQELNNLDVPDLPASPTIVTSGLFRQTAPNTVLPSFNANKPVLHATEIYNALVAVAQPILDKVDLPEITPLTIKSAPVITKPDYTPYQPLGELDDPRDYATYYQTQYDNALPGIRGFVDDVMNQFMQKYAPDYDDVRSKLANAISAGLSGQGLPKPYDDPLYSRQQARITREMGKLAQAIIDDPGYRGYVVAPGEIRSRLNSLQVDAAITLAGASTDAFIEVRRQALQAYQFVLTMADGQQSGLRNMVLQFFDRGLAMIQASVTQAKTLGDLLITRDEHEKSRHEFSLALMRALDEQFKIKLDAALADLEIYSKELEAVKLRSEVDKTYLEAAKLKVDVQKIEVDKYSAIIEAIAKRAVGDELLIKQFDTEAKVFDIQVKAVMAGYDVYKAQIDGDKAKLDGELAKLDIFKTQLQATNLKLDAQKTQLEANIEINKAKLDQYSTELVSYEAAAKIALQRFTAEAEMKKMGLDVYRIESEVELERFRAQVQQNVSYNQLLVEQFRANSASLSNYYQLKKEWAGLQLNAQHVIATGYSTVAAAAMSSVNSMASISEAK